MSLNPVPNGEKQRIVLLTRSLQMGGVERNTVNLANTLAAQGHEVHILSLKKRQVLKPDAGVHVHFFDFDKFNRLTIIGLFYDLFTRTFLATAIRGSGFLWRGFYGGLYFRLWLNRLERRVGRVDRIIARGQGAFEAIWSFRDRRLFLVVVSPVEKNSDGFWQGVFTRALYSRRHIVANSSGTAASLQRHLDRHGVKAGKITLIPNPIPVSRIQALAQESAPVPREPYIVHVARLTYQKNQPLLLRAFHASGIPHKLVVVGAGREEEALRRLARELGIAERVIFAGEQSNPYPWMKGAELFVLSSHFEGFGLVMVEAMATGTPVVAVDCPGGVRDVLIEEQARFIAEPSVSGLAGKIRQALDNPVAVKDYWYERFDAERVARDFLQLN